ncbi:MAG: hypothetical protein FJ087_01075 [Deltaproteobacteria bacterium]|nr:hypothetical protein [Deltaproteobacteria bacterium]
MKAVAVGFAALFAIGCSEGSGGAGGTDLASDVAATIDVPAEAAPDAPADVAPEVAPDAAPEILADLPPPDPPGDPAPDAPACPRPKPWCAHGCGSDWIEEPACDAGRWTCPDGTVLMSDCPPGTCWGMPLPGEVCDGGWKCRPDPEDFSPCPPLMCAVCDGFEGPQTADGCTCECKGSQVECHAAPADEIRLAPATLSFYGLPIGSVRFAVSGRDPEKHACATIVWDFSNTDHALRAHCHDFSDHFPYVIVKTGTDADCGWDYGTDLAVTKADGCVDFAAFGPASLDLVDVDLEVAGAGFAGRIVADNRATYSPTPVNLGIRYSTDVPEDVFVQSSDSFGLPAWVKVRPKGGEPLHLFPLCSSPVCGEEPGGVCDEAFHKVENITGTSYRGSVWLTWDGRAWAMDPDAGCWVSAPALPGDHVAEFCFGWKVSDGPAGQDVVDPFCHEVPFTLPTEEVVYHADFGG